MATSPAVAVAARETHLLPGWRTTTGTAFALVLSRPDLWLIGALSVAARGGLLLLLVPVLTLPSPVGISVILGPALIDSASPALQALLIGSVVVFTAIVIASIVLSAVADLMAFDRYVSDPETLEARGGREPRRSSAGQRLATVLSLSAIQATVLLPAAIALALLAQRAAVLLREELIHPSSSVPLLARMVIGAREQVVLVVMGILLAEVVGSLASRHLLASRYGLGHERSVASEARSLRAAALHVLAAPIVVAARAALGWLIVGALVLPVAAALLIAWDLVRELYLAPAVLDPQVAVARVVVTVVFVGLWASVTLLAGLGSALRGALWSGASLR
jgi:hypothetical protein